MSNENDPLVSTTVSEERLIARTETVARERVRLQRYIVSEQRTFTVTVRREEVRVIREPIDGILVSEDDFDEPITMVLSEERVEVSTSIVPRERVWLQREIVTELVDVTGQVGREQIVVSREASST